MNKDGVTSLWPVIFVILTTFWPRPQLSQFYRYRAISFTRMTLTGTKLIVPHFTIDGDLQCTNFAIQGSTQIPTYLETLPWPQSPISLANSSLKFPIWTSNLTISPRLCIPLVPLLVSTTLNPINSSQLFYSSMFLTEGNLTLPQHYFITTNSFQTLVQAMPTQIDQRPLNPFISNPLGSYPAPPGPQIGFPYEPIGQPDLLSDLPTTISPGNHTDLNPILTRVMPVSPYQFPPPETPTGTPEKLSNHYLTILPVPSLLQSSRSKLQVHSTVSLNTRTFTPSTNSPLLVSNTLVWCPYRSNYLPNKCLIISLLFNHEFEVSPPLNNLAHTRAKVHKIKTAAILAANQRPTTTLTTGQIIDPRLISHPRLIFHPRLKNCRQTENSKNCRYSIISKNFLIKSQFNSARILLSFLESIRPQLDHSHRQLVAYIDTPNTSNTGPQVTLNLPPPRSTIPVEQRLSQSFEPAREERRRPSKRTRDTRTRERKPTSHSGWSPAGQTQGRNGGSYNSGSDRGGRKQN